MKSIFRIAGPVAAIFVMATLTGCATSQAPMGSNPSGDQMGMMDMKAMCGKHQKMKSAKTPEEQKAMMDEHMKTMPPENMQKHMTMMDEKCK